MSDSRIKISAKELEGKREILEKEVNEAFDKFKSSFNYDENSMGIVIDHNTSWKKYGIKIVFDICKYELIEDGYKPKLRKNGKVA